MKDSRKPTSPADRLRAAWTHRGVQRPPFAIEPGPGQESVWDYPRPPLMVPDKRRIEVRHGNMRVALSESAVRVLETASPPTFYLPPGDVDIDALKHVSRHSFCEWKGEADYFRLASVEEGSPPVAWTYPRPFPEFTLIAGWFSFYSGRIACFVAGERVGAQAGGFYGGWITTEVVGPFKGEPGTNGW